MATFPHANKDDSNDRFTSTYNKDFQWHQTKYPDKGPSRRSQGSVSGSKVEYKNVLQQKSEGAKYMQDQPNHVPDQRHYLGNNGMSNRNTKDRSTIHAEKTHVMRTDDVSREEQIKTTVYGQCIGDAIGLLTEFMTKSEAHHAYGNCRYLTYSDKKRDSHRERWVTGDWTDDTDHMILIMQSLTHCNGKVNSRDFAARLRHWADNGFQELGDQSGTGLGNTTYTVISHKLFLSDPQMAAEQTWLERGKTDAANGAVMRTAILGIHEWWDTTKVEENAKQICRTTHFDPRCQASAVAVSVAISLMIQRKTEHYESSRNTYNIDKIIDECYNRAVKILDSEGQKRELQNSLRCNDLGSLKLDENGKIGYTFKCLGAAFWALKQNNFKKAITAILFEGGDADTNCAVAGALLGCKLRNLSELPADWLRDLHYKKWLDEKLNRYLDVLRRMQSKYV
ncbi:hypothetical protein ACJMK2_041366 [Sinanodonta woodiana]|uniref:Uncharacterized protein n=1 Tax=Sinanodonta woodiana TaxID=1069815 RepID=A0ABD3W3W6_SINWO